MSHWDVSIRKGCLLSVCVVGKFRILKLISLNKKRKTLFFVYIHMNAVEYYMRAAKYYMKAVEY